jgi:uncharacterized protein YdiU (UPF0061 family)
MADGRADFTRTFRALSHLAIEPGEADDQLASEFRETRGLADWLVDWRSRLLQEASQDSVRIAAMRQVNPCYIPRNHQVERVIRAFYDDDPAAPALLEDLLTVCAAPFEDHPGLAELAAAPVGDEVVERTYCGT